MNVGERALRDFHAHFKIARGILPIQHFAQSQGVHAGAYQINAAIKRIKALPNPNAADARLQTDLRKYNVRRYQHKNIHPEVKPEHLIPYAANTDFHWVGDLIDMRARPRAGEAGWVVGGANAPRYIFVLINITSRRIFAEAVRSTSFDSIGPAFAKMLTDIRVSGSDIEKLTTDAGSEFVSREFEQLMSAQNIRHILPAGASRANPFQGFSRKPTGAGDKTFTSIVERANQTLRNILARIRTEKNNMNLRWWEFVQKAVRIYNDTLHTEIGETPKDASEDASTMQKISDEDNAAKKQQIARLQQSGELDFEIGEAVQLRRDANRSTFAGKAEGVFKPQQRFIIAGRRGSRYLLLPANTGAGRVNALVPPRLYSPANGRVPVWQAFHNIERVPQAEQPTKTVVPAQAPAQVRAPAPPPPQRRELRRQIRQMNVQNQQERVHPKSRAYAQLHPHATTEEIEREVEESIREKDQGTHKYSTRKRTREREVPARSTRSRQK